MTDEQLQGTTAMPRPFPSIQVEPELYFYPQETPMDIDRDLIKKNLAIIMVVVEKSGDPAALKALKHLQVELAVVRKTRKPKK
jgi:hypothetical protein